MEELEVPEEETEFHFQFPVPEPIGRPVVQVVDVGFGYKGGEQLFKDVNFGIDTESRIAGVHSHALTPAPTRHTDY